MTSLNIDTKGALPITVEATIGEKIAILGIAGGGKTNTAAVMIEEFLTNRLPMTIVDIEGEYWGLKEQFDIVIIGRGENVDVAVDADNAAQFATYSVEHGLSFILDLSGYDTLEDMHDFLIAYFDALWAAASKARRPYVVVVEEAHEFIPQGAATPIKKMFQMLALRGRKRGITMLIISQRSAKVDKNVLTQASFVFLHRVVHPTDIKVYQEILPLPARIVEDRVGALEKGDALVLINHTVHTARIRLRHTYHAGATPELDATHRVQVRRADDKLLDELRKLVAVSEEESKDGNGKAEVARLQGQIERQQGIINTKSGEVTRLKAQVEHLTKEVERWQKAAAAKPVAPLPTNNAQPTTAKRPALVQTQPSGATVLPGVQARRRNMEAREQRRWQALLTDLSRQGRWKRDLIIYLIQREGTSFTVKEMARGLSLEVTTVQRNPPVDLIRMGIINRSGTPGKFKYFSDVRRYLEREYPELDTEHLIEAMLTRLRQ